MLPLKTRGSSLGLKRFLALLRRGLAGGILYGQREEIRSISGQGIFVESKQLFL